MTSEMKPLTVLTVAVLVLGACVDSRGKPLPGVSPDEPATCDDSDGDGFGEGCTQGGDCDDRDPDVHTGCTRCVAPAQGCACDEGSKPVSCYREPSTTDEGTVMCHEGTRYCRDRSWSACESIVSYPRPDELETQAIVDPRAATQHCNDCTVNCFVVRDNLDPTTDAGIKATSQNIASPKGGGLTLKANVQDAGTYMRPPFDPATCVLGAAPDQDCDGVPDVYDPYPSDKPFATANPTIFLDVAPGKTATGAVNLQFYLNSADVYFMIDQSGSMAAERDQLKADLRTGDFIKDSSYECSDYDFDGRPNNELKTQGIIGAVRCIIRDANFGLGYFREIPLNYGNADSVTYRHLQDNTSDIAAVTASVNKLVTVGNNDWPEAAMLGLYAMATGSGYYFGPERAGLEPRVSCPSGTFGYGCFRNNAIPIVLMFTDAQFHNGPVNNDYPYASRLLGFNAGTTTQHTPVASTNETFSNALDLGDITNANLTMIGDSTNMVNDLDSSQVTCGGGTTDDKSPDAMFKFSLTSAKTVTATTFGSEFDTTLSIFGTAPPPATTLPSYPNTNDTAANAYAFNAVNNKFLTAAGNSSSLKHDYSANDVTCSAAADSKDAAFTFNLTQNTRVALSTRGSSYNTSMALFSGAPPINTYTALPTPNTNDGPVPYAVGTINGQNLGFSGDSSNTGIAATYTARQMGCVAPALASDSATDATFSFNVATPTRVRISSEDSTLRGILALTSASGIYVTSRAGGTTIETEATAYNAGALDDKAVQFTGSTSAMRSDYAAALTGCGTGASNDAVYKFTLANTQTLDIDTLNSTFDTSISLFRSTIAAPPAAVAISNTNETATTAHDIGSINGKIFSTSGATTANMVADYTAAQVGCGANTNARDAVYKFTVASPTRVRIDTSGSAFDTVASLHQNLPVHNTTAITTPLPEAVASARAVTVNANTNGSLLTYTGTTASMAANININESSSCTAETTGKDAVFKLTVGTTGSYELNTEGSAFDTVLGLYPDPVADAAPPTATNRNNSGDTRAAANSVGTLTNTSWNTYSGTTTGLAANNTTSNCSALGSSPDVYYSFTLTSRRTVVLNTLGSSFDTVLFLTNSTESQIACNNDYSGTDSQITATLDPGTYYAIIKGRTGSTSGAYRFSIRDSARTDISNTLECDDNSGTGGVTSKFTTTLTAGTTYYAVVKGRRTADSGAYRFTIRNLDALAAPNRVACDNDSAGDNDSLMERDLAAGDYFVIVTGTSSSARGNYNLRVQDITNLPGFVSCNDDSVGQTSRLQPTLPPGTYYVVVRGSALASGAYTLTMRDSDITFTTNYACDYNSGPSGTSLIERDLAAGNYRVVVKGFAAADKGPYKVNIRDVTQTPSRFLQCDAASGGGSSSYLERDLTAGTYTVVLQSRTSGSSGGAYQLSVRDATRLPITPAPYCNNDVASGDITSKISQMLTPGTYYAAVKGNKTANKGEYQFNIGAVGTTPSTFVPPTWAQTRTALTSKSIRVIPVLSCRDDPAHGDAQGDCVATRTQAKALANATNAIGRNLQPLVYDIDGDGEGLSRTVIDGIAAIANYLEMNVSLRVVFEPDANPGFGLVVRAIDAPGDGCPGLIGAEHQRCAPGASPRFEVAFTNPMNRPVPANPRDPYGGYSFRAELIGDNQFIVDKVPIYIIPQVLTPPPPPPVFVPSGTYWQDLSSSNCVGTQRPDWHDLSWNADIPDGTTVSFGVCAADDKTQLKNCMATPFATVTGGRSCARDSDCTDGYCSSKNTCQFITGARCSADKDCMRGATCKSNVCKYRGQPVYIGDALKEKNYTTNLRMQIGLTANTTANTAPTVYDWGINYFCNSAQ
jgi:hypothetical protein